MALYERVETNESDIAGLSGEGGATQLSNLTDVNLTGLSDGQHIAFNQASGDFEPVAPPADGADSTVAGPAGADGVDGVDGVAALGETSITAHRGDHGAAAYSHSISAHANVSAEVNAVQASGGEITTGTETAERSFSPADIKLAAETHGGGGGGRYTEVVAHVDTPTITTQVGGYYYVSTLIGAGTTIDFPLAPVNGDTFTIQLHKNVAQPIEFDAGLKDMEDVLDTTIISTQVVNTAPGDKYEMTFVGSIDRWLVLRQNAGNAF